MPKIVDYAGRFEFTRQAAFAVVRDEGVDALSRRRVAAELGSSVNTIRRLVADWVDLVRLAADQVVSRRRLGRLGRRTEDPIEAVQILITGLMPEDRTHLDEELVWLKLVTACALRPSGLEPPGTVRRDFGIAQRGYDIDLIEPASQEVEQPVTDEPEGDPTGENRPREDRRTALERYLADREEELRFAIGRSFDHLNLGEPRADTTASTIAMIEGLTLSACLGRIEPEKATELAIAYVMTLAPPS